MKKILVTGGLGFIGSETVICLIENGYEPVIVDDLYNAKLAVLDRIQTITGIKPKFYQIDCKNEIETERVFKENEIDAVIHFAGYKAVGESVSKPIEYYENNLETLIVIAKLMKKYNVNNIIFSSSATVYGVPTRVPLYESDPVAEATNPYGETKVMIERILKDIQFAYPNLNVGILRYFNPIGGHPSGLLGEDPNGIPNNLLPYVSQVAIGKLKCLRIFGDDYPTADGTGVRDYIHVVDLANGHVAALKNSKKTQVMSSIILELAKEHPFLNLFMLMKKPMALRFLMKLLEDALAMLQKTMLIARKQQMNFIGKLNTPLKMRVEMPITSKQRILMA